MNKKTTRCADYDKKNLLTIICRLFLCKTYTKLKNISLYLCVDNNIYLTYTIKKNNRLRKQGGLYIQKITTLETEQREMAVFGNTY